MKKGVHRPPWYVRSWGWVLLFVGLFDVLSYAFSLATEDGMTLRPVDFIPTIAIVAGAIGLFSESRWGWSVAMLVGLLGVSAGTYVLLDLYIHGGDITLLGVEFVAMFLVIVGLLLIFCLLTPRTRRWLEQLPRRS